MEPEAGVEPARPVVPAAAFRPAVRLRSSTAVKRRRSTADAIAPLGARSLAVGLAVLFVLLLSAGCATWIRGSELAREYHNIGNAYYDLGRFDRAADYYQRALSLDATLAPAGYNLARVYVRERRYLEAQEVLEELLTRDPDNLVLRETLAYVHYRAGDIRRATVMYEEILALSPYSANALYNLARIAEQHGDIDLSLDYYRDAVAINSSDAELLYRYGRLLAERGDSARSVVILERYLEASPADPAQLADVGDILRRERYFSQSREAYQAIPAAADEYPRALFGKAAVYLLGIQDADEGLVLLEQAFDAGFTDTEAVQALLESPGLVGAEAVRALADERGVLRDDGDPPHVDRDESSENDPAANDA